MQTSSVSGTGSDANCLVNRAPLSDFRRSEAEDAAEDLTEGAAADNIVESGVEDGGEDPFDDEDDDESDPLSDLNHVKRLREMADLLNKIADALTVPDPPE